MEMERKGREGYDKKGREVKDVTREDQRIKENCKRGEQARR